jgi:hypothetical protein
MQPRNSTAILTKAPPSGFVVLVGYVAVLSLFVWTARVRRTEIPDSIGLAMICFSFAWTYLAIWKLFQAVTDEAEFDSRKVG